MKRETKIVGFFLLGALLPIVALQAVHSAPEVNSEPRTMHVGWHRDYESLSALIEDSDIVVVGVVTTLGEAFPVGDGVPFTESQVRVTEVVTGRADIEVGDAITVRQTGGAVPGGRAAYVEDARLFYAGEEVVLFLTPGRAFDAWAPTGGKFGHFTLSDGEVHHANLEAFEGDDGAHPLAVAAEGKAPATFVAEVRSAATAARQ